MTALGRDKQIGTQHKRQDERFVPQMRLVRSIDTCRLQGPDVWADLGRAVDVVSHGRGHGRGHGQGGPFAPSLGREDEGT